MADFLWVVPLDGARVTLDHCLELMPLLEGLWKVVETPALALDDPVRSKDLLLLVVFPCDRNVQSSSSTSEFIVLGG